MGGPLIPGAAPGDQVGGNGPGCPGKADQRGFTRQFAGQDADGFINRRKRVVNSLRRLQRLYPRHGGNGGKPRPFTGFKPEVSPQSLRQQQDVGKQDCGIKAIAPDRLQRHLGSQVRVVAQCQEIPGLRPRGAVFRQIAPGLPHHPDRWGRQGFAGKGAQDQFCHVALIRDREMTVVVLLQLSGRNDTAIRWS